MPGRISIARNASPNAPGMRDTALADRCSPAGSCAAGAKRVPSTVTSIGAGAARDPDAFFAAGGLATGALVPAGALALVLAAGALVLAGALALVLAAGALVLAGGLEAGAFVLAAGALVLASGGGGATRTSITKRAAIT